MSSITWEEVADGPFVGGDLETVEDGQIYRGPISAIWISDGYFNVSSEWVATMKDGAWVEMKSNNNVNVLMSEVSPIDIGDGRIRFSIPYLGAATLFPRGGSKLERPKPVSGS